MRNILFFIVSLSWLFSQIIRVQLGNGLSLNILDIVVGGIALIALVWSIFKRKISFHFKDSVGKMILLFSCITIISLLLNIQFLTFQQFLISSLYIVRWVSYAFLFLVIREFDSLEKNRIRSTMFLTGIFFVAIGFVQFFYYSNLRNLFYLGWDEHLYRLFSVFLDPNFSGVFLALFLLFIVGKRLEVSEKISIKVKLPLSILIAFIISSLILTFSRTGYIALFFAFTLFFFLINKKRWIIIMAGFMIVIGVVLSQRFYIENVNPFRKISSNARLISMKQGLEIFYKQPIFGVGFNAYRYAQLRYGFREQANIDASHADSGTDNSFLFILASTGVVGFIVYLTMLYAILRSLLNLFKKKKQIYTSVVFSSIVGLCVASMFTNALFFPPLMLWIWVLLGTIDYN